MFRRERVQTSDREAGFSLTEIMIAVAIMGLLSTVVVISVLPMLGNARETKIESDLSTLRSALLNFNIEYGRYPTMEEGLGALINPPQSERVSSSILQDGFIEGSSLPEDPWGNPYQYVIPGERGTYDLFTLGADGRLGGEGENRDIGNWDNDETR